MTNDEIKYTEHARGILEVLRKHNLEPASGLAVLSTAVASIISQAEDGDGQETCLTAFDHITREVLYQFNQPKKGNN